MAYATRGDVLARAGRFAGVFQVAGKRPDEADLDLYLEQVSDVIDLEIRARGYDPALISVDAKTSLADVAAWATLVRALPSASPGDDEIDGLVDRGIQILDAAGFPSLAGAGSANIFATLEALEAGEAGGGPGTSAGSLWDELDEIFLPDDLDTVSIPPTFRRGQSL